ncbi:MAG: hypothetical protein KJ792_03015 [Actinobacteria bacterium]|nr:hypothetical protein [Actinomycetota bacterium]MCG2801460.1 hypothetical protein [Cellulomonas sp.]
MAGRRRLVTRALVAVAALAHGTTDLLPIEALTLTASESWQPHVQASIRAPATAASRAADPRLGHTVALTLREVDDGGTIRSSLTTGALSVRVAASDASAGTVTLDLASAEADVQDQVCLTAGLGPTSWAGIREALTDLLTTQVGIPAGSIDLTAMPLATGASLTTGAQVKPGDAWWSTLSDLPQRAGWQLYVDLGGVWRLWDQSVEPTASVAVVQAGVDLEQLTTTISRESTDAGQWANAVVCRYTWTTTAGVGQVIVGRAADALTGGQTRRTMVVTTTDVPVTQAQADARAAALLVRARRRGRSFTVTVPARFDLRTRTAIRLVTTDAESVLCYVIALTWSLPEGTCTLTLRDIS